MHGSQTLFWQDRWLDESSIQSLAPDGIIVVSKRVRSSRLVVEDMHV
jgi:hypothetical protein